MEQAGAESAAVDRGGFIEIFRDRFERGQIDETTRSHGRPAKRKQNGDHGGALIAKPA